jgi:hypothetical protein
MFCGVFYCHQLSLCHSFRRFLVHWFVTEKIYFVTKIKIDENVDHVLPQHK